MNVRKVMARTKKTSGVSPGDSMTVAATRIVDERAKRIFELRDAVAKPDNVEAVHDMRVATRRLRAVLDIFEPCFAAKPHARVTVDVKSITRALGQHRDLDVQIGLLEPLAAQAAVADRHGIETLIESRRELRGAAQLTIPDALAILDEERFRADLAKLVATKPPKPAKPGAVKRIDPSVPVIANARLILLDRTKVLSKLADAAVEGRRAKQLHATRIAAKHLRYAIHAVDFCFDDRLTEVHDHARTIQNILGELHDCVVLGEVVDAALGVAGREDANALADGAPPGPEHLQWPALRTAPHRREYPGLAKLAVLLAGRREAARRQFIDYWAPLAGGELRRQVRSAVAENGK